MTDKEKLKEIKKLADAMYYAAFNLTMDASLLRKAMKEYHQFIIHEYCKEEPVAPKVLEDMLNAKTAAESLGISQEEHDRIVDELIYGKEPEYLDDFLALEEIPPKFPLISQKKCMYTKDDFTDEDRKVLCDGCEEECEYAQKKEPVSEDFEMALAEMIDKAQKCVVEPWVVAAQWKDELIKLAKSEEPVSEELEEAAFDYAEACKYNGGEKLLCVEHFKAGAKWQKEQMMKDAVDAECDVILLEEGDELQYSVLYPKGKKPFNKGDLAKLIIVKED